MRYQTLISASDVADTTRDAGAARRIAWCREIGKMINVELTLKYEFDNESFVLPGPRHYIPGL